MADRNSILEEAAKISDASYDEYWRRCNEHEDKWLDWNRGGQIGEPPSIRLGDMSEFISSRIRALKSDDASVSDMDHATVSPAATDGAVNEAWQPIESAPKDGTEILVFHPDAGVCAAFCPGDGFAWHCMDGSNTTVGSKSGVSIPRMTSFISPPTHWTSFPPPPGSGDRETVPNGTSSNEPTITDADVERAAKAICAVANAMPDYALAQMNELLAADFARAALSSLYAKGK